MSAVRNAIGRAKGYGGCLRCGGTWDYTDGHKTPFKAQRSCFPLCEVCWSVLTPNERMPYYAELVAVWIKAQPWMGPDYIDDVLADWPLIRAAVEAGL